MRTEEKTMRIFDPFPAARKNLAAKVVRLGAAALLQSLRGVA